MSPAHSGAPAAGLPGSTCSTSSPNRRSSRRTGRSVTPNEKPDAPRRRKAVSAFPGTAAPSPFTIMVLMPITRPRASASGPPELPGASRTSASTQRCAPNPARLPSRYTTPVVSAPMKPMGLPMAITNSPMRSALESPKLAAGRPLAVTCSVARSRRTSRATSRAGYSRPSHSRTDASPRATCALVTIWPSGVAIRPDPAPDVPRRRTSTVERRKRSAISPNAPAMSVFPPGPLAHRYAYFDDLAAAHDARRDGLAHRVTAQRRLDVVRIVYGLASQGHHDVADQDTGARGGTFGFRREDDQAGAAVRQRHRMQAQAEIAA